MDGLERAYGPKECGSCRLWRPILEDERGPIGPCRLRVRTGDFPGSAPRCERYLARDEALPARPPPPPTRRHAAAPPRVHHAEPLAPGQGPGGAALDHDIPEEILHMTREEFAQAIRDVLREEQAQVQLSPKWEGGTALLKPRDPALQAKEIPLDQLFHKVVMVRDRLRVLEQKINAHDKLTDAEKVDLQSYVTKCYGSLTTFNVLFRDERDRFVGEKA
ncbi:hypothetical protein [Anaeromyxobacter diazotrophicus]|uniref:Uncharacterized protein n=1 Tax=Anaeromyxobacter diazotrophicus TaxID=2590199 RepID=A0A7I9VLA2_9BACT|nr:hypothetical protein [Anaeromyxobacter diazotrophicus]GEJ57194.1 hypothetical protein AMYX_19350 [Anaeromyxobacter diazotrophicus]